VHGAAGPPVVNHRAHRLLLRRLDPAITFLNHGSFGSCPLVVLEEQQRWRQRMERQPVQFFLRDLGALLDAARAELAAFIDAEPSDVAFVPNATAGVNAVLRSRRFDPGDELLTTNHAYNACRNALEFAAQRSGARVVVADVPFPVDGTDRIVTAVLQRITPRTRLALLDHVTSPTALVLPIREVVRALAERGVDALVDGAHAPGMVSLSIRDVGAAYYTGNCHKWLCAPKGAGFLHVRRDKQEEVRPIAISHGANARRTDRSRFLMEFDWTGTHDPSPYLCIPPALRFMGALQPGGWAAVRQRNHDVTVAARRRVCAALGIALPCPDEMLGSMATIPIADGPREPPASALSIDPLQDLLLSRYHIEVPVFPWPAPPKRCTRFSVQAYNTPEQLELLAQALRATVASA
jgi:isopenicillin-N epimerase